MATVNPDWEEGAGLVFEINQVAVNSDVMALIKHFRDEPIFKGIVEALQNINTGLNLHECKQAQHRTANYMIEDGRLWYIGGRTPTRVITRRECITQKEAIELAQMEHEAYSTKSTALNLTSQ